MTTKHPLDDEDVRVEIVVTHLPTEASVGAIITPVIAGPALSDVVQATLQQLMDELLAQLEVQGG